MIEVLILTKSDCDFCDLAKEILERISSEYALSVSATRFDSREGEALAIAHRALFPPVIFIDGEFFCYGRLSERRLRRELDRRSASARKG